MEGEKTLLEKLVKEEKEYTLVLHNDATTDIEIVAALISALFGKSAEDAVGIILAAQMLDKAVIGKYSLDICKSYLTLLQNFKDGTGKAKDLKITIE